MIVTCSQDRLNKAVQTVQKAIASKTPMPILTGIYLAAKNNRLELQATDYEIGISCTIDAEVDEEGVTVLSGRMFQDMVRRLPGEKIRIETDQQDKTIKITADTSTFNLLCLPAEEFPVLTPFADDNVLYIKDNVLREMIKKTTFACATEDSRPIFTGALLEASNQSVCMVATNTHRLALKKDAIDSFEGMLKMIIPSKILNEIARLLTSDIPFDVKISWQKNQVSFFFDDVYIVSRLIEGAFPDYNKVIPQDFATIVTVKTDLFLDAVERVSLIAREGDYNIIKFHFKDNQIVITSANPELGKAQEIITADIKGNELDIAFNAKYVSDILKNSNSEQVIFSLNTPLSPAAIRPEANDQYTYIITPVRAN
ncbi:MAG: DNA polymerase III subunit beta [Sporomusaceae bacterium]|nr:DNA polymerase III subunit beta [Sporomusaceae bacterium]